MFDAAKPGDTVVVLEVSRLCRSSKQLCDIVDLIKYKKLRLQIVGSITLDCRYGELDPMSEAFLQIAGVFAQLELAMIRSRVKSGIENARAKGKRIGRPPLTTDEVPEYFFRYYAMFKAGSINISEMARLAKISRPTAYRYVGVIEDAQEEGHPSTKKGAKKSQQKKQSESSPK